MYSIEEIKAIVEPIALKHNLKSVFLFGSYARGNADESSDIDLIYDRSGSNIRTLSQAAELYLDLNDAFETDIDLVPISALSNTDREFSSSVSSDMVMIYDRV